MAQRCRGRNRPRCRTPESWEWHTEGVLRTLARVTLLLAISSAFSTLPAQAQLSAELVASGLTRPLSLVAYPGRPGTFLVAEQAGLVRVAIDGVIQAEPFLDLREDIASGGEQGLLGLALAPDFVRTGR